MLVIWKKDCVAISYTKWMPASISSSKPVIIFTKTDLTIHILLVHLHFQLFSYAVI